jgi:hypothetical protein
LIQAFKKLIHYLHTNTETIKSRHDNNLKTTKNITVPHDQVLKKTNFTQKKEHPLTHHTSYLKNHKITAIPSDQKHNLQQKNSNATPTHMKHFVGSHATYPDNNFPQKWKIKETHLIKIENKIRSEEKKGKWMRVTHLFTLLRKNSKLVQRIWSLKLRWEEL